MTTTTSDLTRIALARLTIKTLRLKFSPPQAGRLWELHGMGVSLGTLARAYKILRAFEVTPETDHEWLFCALGDDSLELWHEASGTRIEVEAVDTPQSRTLG